MTDFIVTITDPAQLDGITWAREQYNATLPPPMPPPMPPPIVPDPTVDGMTPTVDGMTTADEMTDMPSPLESPPEPVVMATALETDQDYVQWVMENASISYADQKLRAEHRQNYENAAEAARMSRKV